MATQFTEDRERNLIKSGYVPTDYILSQEEIKQIRRTHFVTEMKYTTKERGEPKYVIWMKPKKHTTTDEHHTVLQALNEGDSL